MKQLKRPITQKISVAKALPQETINETYKMKKNITGTSKRKTIQKHYCIIR